MLSLPLANSKIVFSPASEMYLPSSTVNWVPGLTSLVAEDTLEVSAPPPLLLHPPSSSADAINKTSSSVSYSINPLVLYNESKINDLASNLYHSGSGLYYFKSHEKVTVTLNDFIGGVETRNAYVRAHFDPGVNYLYIDTSESGSFGQDTKSYYNFSLHSFYASSIKETEALSSGVIRLSNYVSDTKSYKLEITDSRNVWTIPSIELFR